MGIHHARNYSFYVDKDKKQHDKVMRIVQFLRHLNGQPTKHAVKNSNQSRSAKPSKKDNSKQ